MKISLVDARVLSDAVRAARKAAGLRQDDLAAMAGVSKQFAYALEAGKPTVQLNSVLKVLAQLGLALSVELPESAAALMPRVQQRTRTPRRKAAQHPEPAKPPAEPST